MSDNQGKYDQLYTSHEAEVDLRFEPNLTLIGDWEGLKITNYQLAGEHAAQRLMEAAGDGPVVEVCSGIGATTFVLARHFLKVYTVDINPKRLEMCRNNLQRLGLADRVELINGDILDPKTLNYLSGQGIRAAYTDVNFTASEDWQNHESDIAATSPSTPALNQALTQFVTSDICMKLPKTINLSQLREMADCEIESITPDGRLSFYLVYLGQLIKAVESTYSFPRQYPPG